LDEPVVLDVPPVVVVVAVVPELPPEHPAIQAIKRTSPAAKNIRDRVIVVIRGPYK